MQPGEVVGEPDVDSRLLLPGTSIAVRDDSPQVPVVLAVPTVERPAGVSLTGVFTSLSVATAYLVVDVVVVVTTLGQDGETKTD